MGGISGISPQQWQDLQATGFQQDSSAGEAYDMGGFDDNPQQQNTGQTELTPKRLFAVAEKSYYNQNNVLHLY